MARGHIAAILISAILAYSPAQAKPIGQPFMPGGEIADAPMGFVDMCARDKQLCMTGTLKDIRPELASLSMKGTPLLGATGTPAAHHFSEDNSADYTPQSASVAADEASLHRLIVAINSQVNRHVIQRTDMEAMGVGEYWRPVPTGDFPVGDCEDIAISKRLRLTEAGFPGDRLFYGIAFLRRGGLHTVLVARMADGDYVLDSVTPHVLRWDKVRYTWLRQQVPGAPLLWTRVGGAPTPNYVGLMPTVPAS